MKPPMKISLGDIVRMKKPHPCGSDVWEVTRTGIDIGMKCQGCGRRVMIPRTQFEKSVKAFVKQAGAGQQESKPVNDGGGG